MLSTLASQQDENLLVGFDQNDDAGVYRLNHETALVMTADFITPPVDDPVIFGKVAAANALSDVYAMGGRPLVCLNLVAYPAKKLGEELLAKIIAGAHETILEAGAVLAGGHSVDDDEPKFGLSVTGLVHPDRIWRNGGAKAGDVLILTKPVGSGVLFNANLKGNVTKQAMQQCLDVVMTLNKQAAETLLNFEVHAATDVTGFGLLGHALEMASASKMTLQLEFNRIPQMAEAMKMYKKGIRTGSNNANRQLVEAHVQWKGQLSAIEQEFLMDPQTSGGLLVAIPAEQENEALSALHQAGVHHATKIGQVVEQDCEFLHIL